MNGEDPVVREAVEALRRGELGPGIVGPDGRRMLQKVAVPKTGDPYYCPRCRKEYPSQIGNITAPDGTVIFEQVPIPVGVELTYLPEDTEPYFTCPICRIRQQRKGIPKLRRRKERANGTDAPTS